MRTLHASALMAGFVLIFAACTPAAEPASPTPAAPGTPAAPATPTATGTPAAPATPAATGTPAAPDTPAAPGTPAHTPGADVSFELRYGVLAGLTGDLAVSGQPWAEAARVAIEEVQRTLDEEGLGEQITVTLAAAEDSQGNATGGAEAATKLVQVDRVNVIVGDFFSSVTIAVAEGVTIPNNVLVFTGGTSPAITDLDDNQLVWRPVTSDALQGQVAAQILTERFGSDATINLGYRNDAYGAGLADVFRRTWTEGGGTIGADVGFAEGAATLDTEAGQIAAGEPDGWFIIAFCGDWGKLSGPLQRAAGWDPARTFGADAMFNCEGPEQMLPGMSGTIANSTGGSSFPAFQQLFESESSADVAFQGFTAQAFDSVFVSFLGALAAGSSDPNEVKEHLQDVSGPPGTQYTFEQFGDAIHAVLAGEDIDFEGATGPIDFDENGDVSVNLFDVWEADADGQPVVVETIPFSR